MAQQQQPAIVAIIPARGGSKGIPQKNIVPLCGRPLIAYTLEVAAAASMIDAAIVSTDAPEIVEVVRDLGGDAPFLRPPELAADTSPDIDFLKHAVTWLEAERGWTPEIVVILQPTLPFRNVDDVDNALRFMVETGCDSLRTLTDPGPHTPFKMWFLDDPETGQMQPVLKTEYYDELLTDVPRQLLRKAYWTPGVVIATRPRFVKAGKVFGPDLRGFVIAPEDAFDIDSPFDLRLAELMMRERRAAAR
jgi:CMP-N-acetylneuraminic acid synthetase